MAARSRKALRGVQRVGIGRAPRRADRSYHLLRASVRTLTGPMTMNFMAFQTATRTTRFNQPGPPSTMERAHHTATARYGTARSMAGTPHLRPRLARMKSSRMLVGRYRRVRSRVRTLTAQRTRSMIGLSSHVALRRGGNLCDERP